MANAEGIDLRARRRRTVFTVLAVLIAELLVVGAAGAATVSHRHGSGGAHGDPTDAGGDVHLAYCALTSGGQGIVRVRVANTHADELYYFATVELDGGGGQVGTATVDTLVPAHRTAVATAYGTVPAGVLGPLTCTVTSAQRNTVNVFPMVD
jgi:hypothetical protein